MSKPIYVVQWNLGGLTGPIEMHWKDRSQCYWSKCGDFDYDPQDAIRDRVWKVAFNKKVDAENFCEGCKFTCQWFRERMDTND